MSSRWKRLCTRTMYVANDKSPTCNGSEKPQRPDMGNKQAGAAPHMSELPPGKTIGDVLPQFADVKHELGPIGKPCPDCAGCSKPFTAARIRKQVIRVYSASCLIPVIVLYHLCSRCAKRNKAGGVKRERLLAAIEKFVLGEGPAA